MKSSDPRVMKRADWLLILVVRGLLGKQPSRTDLAEIAAHREWLSAHAPRALRRVGNIVVGLCQEPEIFERDGQSHAPRNAG